jgi:hypothetical protein
MLPAVLVGWVAMGFGVMRFRPKAASVQPAPAPKAAAPASAPAEEALAVVPADDPPPAPAAFSTPARPTAPPAQPATAQSQSAARCAPVPAVHEEYAELCDSCDRWRTGDTHSAVHRSTDDLGDRARTRRGSAHANRHAAGAPPATDDASQNKNQKGNRLVRALGKINPFRKNSKQQRNSEAPNGQKRFRNAEPRRGGVFAEKKPALSVRRIGE